MFPDLTSDKRKSAAIPSELHRTSVKELLKTFI